MQHDVPRSRLRLIAFVPGFVYVDDPDDVLPDIPQVPVPEEPVALIPQEPVPVEPEAVSQAMVEFRSSGDTMVEMERQMFDTMVEFRSAGEGGRPSSTVGPSSPSPSLSSREMAYIHRRDANVGKAMSGAKGRAMLKAKAKSKGKAKARSTGEVKAKSKGKAKAKKPSKVKRSKKGHLISARV